MSSKRTQRKQPPRASFGYADVGREEKAGLVKGVFDSVARRYDLMNDLMSGGLHRHWKSEMVTTLAPAPGEVILDVAGGTGDIAFRIDQHVRRRGGFADIRVIDINEEMLAVGKRRSKRRAAGSTFQWVVGDAEALPVEDQVADGYTIAFGIRNVTDIAASLREAYRVLKIGGRFFCLEFSPVDTPGVAELYERYSFDVIPWLGKRVARDEAAYRYLVESIRRFPRPEDFAALMRAAGFANIRQRKMAGGVVVLHSGWRL